MNGCSFETLEILRPAGKFFPEVLSFSFSLFFLPLSFSFSLSLSFSFPHSDSPPQKTLSFLIKEITRKLDSSPSPSSSPLFFPLSSSPPYSLSSSLDCPFSGLSVHKLVSLGAAMAGVIEWSQGFFFFIIYLDYDLMEYKELLFFFFFFFFVSLFLNLFFLFFSDEILKYEDFIISMIQFYLTHEKDNVIHYFILYFYYSFLFFHFFIHYYSKITIYQFTYTQYMYLNS